MMDRFFAGLLCAGLVLLAAGPAFAQERFAHFVASEQEDVERMLKLAGLRDGDVVVDLGSGDGRIVLTAARMNPKVTGWGVDVDEKLVVQSNQAAVQQGLAERVKFYHRNAFDADLSNVTVIAMWMWPEIKRMLRTKILAEARPGTRVVTNIWGMGDAWKPDRSDPGSLAVHMWVVPAKLEGYWSWELPIRRVRASYSAVLDQQFQQAEGVVRVGHRRGVFEDMTVNGAQVSFRLDMTIDGAGYARHEFTGTVNGDTIVGTVRIGFGEKGTSREELETVELPWHATRSATSAYFAPTGLGPR